MLTRALVMKQLELLLMLQLEILTQTVPYLQDTVISGKAHMHNGQVLSLPLFQVPRVTKEHLRSADSSSTHYKRHYTLALQTSIHHNHKQWTKQSIIKLHLCNCTHIYILTRILINYRYPHPKFILCCSRSLAHKRPALK